MSEGLSNKEMLVRVLDQNEKALIAQTTMLANIVDINQHLNLLNSKVATHVKEISGLKEEHTKVKAVAAVISVLFGIGVTAINFLFK